MAKQDSNSMTLTIIGGAIIVIVVIIMLIVIHNKKSTNNTPPALTASQKATDKQAIENNWKNFFAASTPLKTRESLLQNGSSFTQPIQEEFTELSSQASSAVISNVDVENSSSATVSYTIDLNGQPVLKDQTGKAVFVDSAWKVSDSTLCGLLSMGGSHPTACKNV